MPDFVLLKLNCDKAIVFRRYSSLYLSSHELDNCAGGNCTIKKILRNSGRQSRHGGSHKDLSLYNYVRLILSTFMCKFAHKCRNVFYGKESI